MRVNNRSDRATAELKALLKFAARSIRDTGIDVHVTNSRGKNWGGMAYREIPGRATVSHTAQYLVTIRIPERLPKNANEAKYKLKGLTLKYPKGMPIESWQDYVIYIAAHKLRHIWQFQRTARTGQRGKGAYDREKFAYARLNRWRMATNRSPIYPKKQPNPFKRREPLLFRRN